MGRGSHTVEQNSERLRGDQGVLRLPRGPISRTAPRTAPGDAWRQTDTEETSLDVALAEGVVSVQRVTKTNSDGTVSSTSSFARSPSLFQTSCCFHTAWPGRFDCLVAVNAGATVERSPQPECRLVGAPPQPASEQVTDDLTINNWRSNHRCVRQDHEVTPDATGTQSGMLGGWVNT